MKENSTAGPGPIAPGVSVAADPKAAARSVIGCFVANPRKLPAYYGLTSSRFLPVGCTAWSANGSLGVCAQPVAAKARDAGGLLALIRIAPEQVIDGRALPHAPPKVLRPAEALGRAVRLGQDVTGREGRVTAIGVEFSLSQAAARQEGVYDEGILIKADGEGFASESDTGAAVFDVDGALAGVVLASRGPYTIAASPARLLRAQSLAPLSRDLAAQINDKVFSSADPYVQARLDCLANPEDWETVFSRWRTRLGERFQKRDAELGPREASREVFTAFFAPLLSDPKLLTQIEAVLRAGATGDAAGRMGLAEFIYFAVRAREFNPELIDPILQLADDAPALTAPLPPEAPASDASPPLLRVKLDPESAAAADWWAA